ncbi:hypothetical protein KBY27_21605 [Ruegeria pomeroyi]|uniref:Uncharacterized protein n=1 Tax=Ruegeria pomeroyi TaxID=89184 RepID=A0A9Q3WS27_9RHOB|nr:hypothetical protein [Ruegeria pomeroyi]MCE8519038.1 hypothetical protein [Ruegeria pomeroyi]MCE8540067.1 hypothetical protein [Ruegeria pomeroyi]
MLLQLKNSSLGRALWRLRRAVWRLGKRAAPIYERIPSPAHLKAANRAHNREQQRILAAFERGDS